MDERFFRGLFHILSVFPIDLRVLCYPCKHACTHMHQRKHTNARTHAHSHTYTHTHAHTCTDTLTHTLTYTLTYTHTCTEHKVGLSIPLLLSPFLHVILSILGVYFVCTGTLCISGVQFLLLTTVHVDGAPHDMWERQQPDEINTSE